MSEPVAVVTGAGGEMGHLLVPGLRARGFQVVALDLAELPENLAGMCLESVRCDIRDGDRLRDLFARHRPRRVFHLAAVLSTTAEEKPDLAHDVNVGGTVAVLSECRRLARQDGRDVRVLYPSSIAVYGFPDASTKAETGAVLEEEWTQPRGMYGCNKLYGEALGRYYTERAKSREEAGVDFRAIRFPGLISASTVPSGGTSDYGPEMLHAAAQGAPYSCFVREDTRLPFMTMPDAVEAFLRLADAEPGRIGSRVYNIQAFSPTAGDFRDAIVERFPTAAIAFEPVARRQAIVDSWPAEVNDSRARTEWGFSPHHGFLDALDGYLLPALRRRYSISGAPASSP